LWQKTLNEDKDMIKINVPIRLETVNIKKHWAMLMRKNRVNAMIVRAFLKQNASVDILPCKATMVRIAPRFLDTDNLYASFKGIRDTVADWLIPGLAPGRADGSKDIEWAYEQRKAGVKEYAVEIRIEKIEK